MFLSSFDIQCQPEWVIAMGMPRKEILKRPENAKEREESGK
jgi:hypothetical protein